MGRSVALDPRNPELLSNAAFTYAILRQFPTALKLYDRALDIVPNDPDLMAIKATVYQAQGNLHEAAKLLTEVDAQTPSGIAFGAKLAQLRLERNHGEAIRLLQTRLAQFPFGSEMDRGVNQVLLALAQRLAGDSTAARATAEQARNTLEPLFRNQPDNPDLAAVMALADASLEEKDSALKAAERATVLLPSSKDRVNGPAFEENLALIQAMFGETTRAISTLTRLLQTPHSSFLDGPELTTAILKIDPLWDPLRRGSRFPKAMRGKAAVNARSFFAELKRRNVYKVAVAYAVVGWAVDPGRYAGVSVPGNSELDDSACYSSDCVRFSGRDDYCMGIRAYA